MVVKILLDRLCDEFDNERQHIEALLELLAAGAAPLYIVRYRKSAIGGMDLQKVREIERRYRFLDLMERRRTRFFAELEKSGKSIDPAQEEVLKKTFNAARFDDITQSILPPKSAKRRTKKPGQAPRDLDPDLIAPLVEKIKAGDLGGRTLLEVASECLDAKAGLADAQAVLDFATRELSRSLSIDPDILHKAREKAKIGVLHVRSTENNRRGAEKYQELDRLREPLSRIPPRKMLAILRGAKERHLHVEILIDQVPLLAMLEEKYFPNMKKMAGELKRFIQDVLRNTLTHQVMPRCQTALLDDLKDKSARQVLKPIQDRLKSLLMAPPFPGQTILAIEPGPKKENRMVVASPDGSFLNDGIFHLGNDEKRETAKAKILEFIEKYGVTFIAVAAARGQGKEIKGFLKEITKDLEKEIPIETVGDVGARNWGSSQAANQELPDVEPANRAVLSLARRVLDPLAEFIRIDPNILIGGSNAADIPIRMLRSALDEIIEACVAEVGPDLNYAPPETLARAPGLDSRCAREIDGRRSTHFKNLAQLQELESFSDKVFRNCAGFLRLHESDNPLDVTQIHPEHYELIAKIAQDCQVAVADLLGNKEKLEALNLENYANDGLDMTMLEDIKQELLHPGIDPRGTYEILKSDPALENLEALQVEMKVKGRITRITDFGIFVDIGVGPEGLVHESRIPGKRGEEKLNKFTVGQIVEVRVIHIDIKQDRLALSMHPEGDLRPEGRERRDDDGSRGSRRRPRRRNDSRDGDFRRRDSSGNRRGRYERRAKEMVFEARPSQKDKPAKTQKGEITDLSDLKALFAPPPKKEVEPPPTPAATEPIEAPQEQAPENVEIPPEKTETTETSTDTTETE